MRRTSGRNTLGWMALVALALALGGCGGDYEVAYADVTFTPAGADVVNAQNQALLDPDPAVLDDPVPDERVDPVPEEQPDPEDPPTVEPDPEQPPDEPPSDEYDPPWTDHDDPAVEGCLEAFPAICNKIDECGEEQPILGLLGGFCPTLFDAINPMLTIGCEQVGNLLAGAGIELPIGGDISGIISNLLKGCIENFQCDPEYLAEFGAKFAEVIQAFGGALGGGEGGGGGNFQDGLPALLELAQMCGGLGALFPF